MKLKYIYTLLLSFILLGFSACSSDDDNNAQMPANVLVDKEYIELSRNQNAEIKITEGNGSYSAVSVDNKIADVSISGDKITVKGVASGKTFIVISDQAGRQQMVTVLVYFDNIVLDKESIDDAVYIDGVAGLPTKITVLEGNGDYKIEADADKVSGVVDGNTITLTPRYLGFVDISIVDRIGHKKTITMTSVDPYTSFKASDIIQYSFDGLTWENEVNPMPDALTFYNTTANGMNMYGWDYYSYYLLEIYFPGDKSVGIKEGSQINAFYRLSTDGLADLNWLYVIKNDGEKIWIVFSYLTSNGIEYKGQAIQKINPDPEENE